LRIGYRLTGLNHSSGYEILALAYAGLKMPNKAISTLEEGVRLAPSVWLLWELLGNQYSDQGGYRDAQRCYSESVACAPKSTPPTFISTQQSRLHGRSAGQALEAQAR
jgi:tetratricopeptide (TPR) repeat protein